MLENKEKLPPVKSNITYLFCILSLIVLGICFTNILDYWIEDHFSIPINNHYPFFELLGSYAHNISWQIIASIAFLILFFLDRYLIVKMPSIPFSEKRRKSLTFLIVIFALSMVVILASIIYSYSYSKNNPYIIY